MNTFFRNLLWQVSTGIISPIIVVPPLDVNLRRSFLLANNRLPLLLGRFHDPFKFTLWNRNQSFKMKHMSNKLPM
jgi:hypothetical protein